MSDEQRKDEETEVEGHGFRFPVGTEPTDEGEDDDDVDAHVMRME
jgi:hypothetical protein